MRTMLKTLLTAAVLAGMAAPAAAQSLKLNPRVGLYAPLTDLGDAGSTIGTITTDRSGTLAYGLGVELAFPVFPVNIRANLDYVTGSEVSLDDGSVTTTTEREVIMLAGDLVFRPLPRLILIEPYFFAGGGIRQYDFDVPEVEDVSDPMLHLGGGAELGLGPLTLNGEVGDYISWYEPQPGADSEIQHDLFVSIGLVLGLL